MCDVKAGKCCTQRQEDNVQEDAGTRWERRLWLSRGSEKTSSIKTTASSKVRVVPQEVRKEPEGARRSQQEPEGARRSRLLGANLPPQASALSGGRNMWHVSSVLLHAPQTSASRAPPLLQQFSKKAPFHQQVGTNESETATVLEPSAPDGCAVEGKEDERKDGRPSASRR